MVISEVERLAAFSVSGQGGNAAGVVVCSALPPASRMQEIAGYVGFSETAFAAPVDGAWRVRYFAPRMEVPFCGHATIALGAALADRHGDGVFRLHLNDTAITVEGRAGDAGLHAALHSPATHSERAAAGLLDRRSRCSATDRSTSIHACRQRSWRQVPATSHWRCPIKNSSRRCATT